jgi:hypothetical protein
MPSIRGLPRGGRVHAQAVELLLVGLQEGAAEDLVEVVLGLGRELAVELLVGLPQLRTAAAGQQRAERRLGGDARSPADLRVEALQQPGQRRAHAGHHRQFVRAQVAEGVAHGSRRRA